MKPETEEIGMKDLVIGIGKIIVDVLVIIGFVSLLTHLF